MNKIILTIIVDNRSECALSGEWGLCILVEYKDKKILLDSGSSDLFATNMKELGFDISDIDYATLSHAHYDHANGWPHFLSENRTAKLFLRQTTSDNCFKKIFIFKKYIGIPRKMTEKYADRIEFVTGDYMICDGVWLIPHKTMGLDSIGRRELMFQKHGRKYVPDDFSHEQSLVLETDKGLVILNSCSHGGVTNIVNEVSDTFPGKHICAYIGGMHLFNKSEEEVRVVAEGILETGIERICTGHCTKNRAYNIMKETLGDRLTQFSVGMRIEV